MAEQAFASLDDDQREAFATVLAGETKKTNRLAIALCGVGIVIGGVIALAIVHWTG